MSSDRRQFLMQSCSGVLSLAALQALPSTASAASSEAGSIPAPPPPAGSGSTKPVELPPLDARTEAKKSGPFTPLPPNERVGFAIVGLGHLALDEILPAFAQSRLCRPTALVSGNAEKAKRVARQYGIADEAVFNYENFDRIAERKDVDVVFIVLPNSMHKEFTVRAAQAGKHVLCEKPMATNSADAQAMVDACKQAKRKLMIAYRQHFEPNNLMIKEMIQKKTFGAINLFEANNSQNQGDPNQWRQKKALAGGGPLPDVGIYCYNAVRFLSGEEPTEVMADLVNKPNDPRFREVEAAITWQMTFPSGLRAICSSSYNSHNNKFFRFSAERGWFGLDPAFQYRGTKMQISAVENGLDVKINPNVEDANQFALEMDHMAECVRENKTPQCPGEEGVRDMKIMEAIYESARTRRPVKLNSTPSNDGED